MAVDDAFFHMVDLAYLRMAKACIRYRVLGSHTRTSAMAFCNIVVHNDVIEMYEKSLMIPDINPYDSTNTIQFKQCLQMCMTLKGHCRLQAHTVNLYTLK